MRRGLVLLLALMLVVSVPPCHAFAATLTQLGVHVSADPAVISEAGYVNLAVDIELESGVVGNSVTVLEVSCQGVTSENPGVVFYGQRSTFELYDVYVPQELLGKPMEVEILYINLDGQLINESHYFTAAQPTATIFVSRMLEPAAPKVGELVRLLYVVSNTGTADVTDVRILDDYFDNVATFDLLGAGQQLSVETSFIMPSSDIVSKGVVEYVDGAGSLKSEPFDAVTISKQVFALKLQAAADVSQISYGEMFYLSCTLTNSGRVAYTNVTLKCNHLEDLPVIEKLEPGQTYVFGRWVTPAASRSYELEASGTDLSGESYTISAPALSVEVSRGPQLDTRVLNQRSDAASGAVALKVWADQTQLDSQGLVSFEVTVSHPDLALEDVVIRENTQGKLETIQILPSGEQLFKYSVQAEQSGTYQFSLSACDENGVAVLALSEPVSITVNPPQNEPMQHILGSMPITPAQDVRSDNTEGIVLIAIGAVMVFSAALLVRLILRDRVTEQKN